MDVHKDCVTGPSVNFLDCVILTTIELHCHCMHLLIGGCNYHHSFLAGLVFLMQSFPYNQIGTLIMFSKTISQFGVYFLKHVEQRRNPLDLMFEFISQACAL